MTVKKPQRIRPIACVWTGEHFIPLPRFKRLCNQQFEVNEEYALIPSEDRSMSSHRGYFAQIREAFDNLAEEYANGYPSPEHMRAAALVEAGYCTESNYVMDSPKEARQLGIALRRMSPLAIIRISGNVVKHFEAESQSCAAMKKEKFEASKKAVLAIVASMARTTPAELKKNAGKSA
jgi:hypothetical protein